MAQQRRLKRGQEEIPPPKMSFEELLAWADEDTWAEWIEGEVVRLSPASNRHQDIVGFLAVLLRFFAEAKQLGVVLTAPFLMKTGPELSAREPDLLFIAKEHLGRLKETHLEGPADLVVEVVSPESRVRDREEKRREYERGGVQEYWVIDYQGREAEFYCLGEGDQYKRVKLEEGGIYRSRVLEGLWIEVGWLWQEPLPSVLSILKTWQLV